MKVKKKRLDEYLIETYKISPNIAESLILQGNVLVNQQKVIKKNYLVSSKDIVSLKKEIFNYPSRAAYKLKNAINELKIQDKIYNKICVDIGASHGGFTKVLLENKARKIYAIDVAKGIIDYHLRIQSKIILLEEKNIKNICIDDFVYEDYHFSPWFITCDVSFISILSVFDSLKKWMEEIKKNINPDFYFYGIFLLKPQFESSKFTIKGIIKDDNLREEIIMERIKKIQEKQFLVLNHFPSSIKGTKGNIEEILYIKSN
jgi:23S rRNA (cytidine1920-2'-O)/16S rRNA (cytidine1409-2'-O)-methyltransferase